MGFTKKAHESNDIGLTAQMNTILQAEEVTNKPTPPHDAVKQLANGGVDVEKLTPTTDGYNYVYDLDVNRMFLLNDQKEIVAPTNITFTKDLNVFAFVGNENEITNWNGCSIYLKSGFTFNNSKTLTLSTGLDVGDNEIDTINYTNTTGNAKNVIIRTNGGDLNINAAIDNVSHYSNANFVDIKAVARSSYHKYCKVGFISIDKGRVVIENSEQVVTIYATTDTVQVDNNSGTLENAYVANGVTASGNIKFENIPNDKTIDEIKSESITKNNAVAKVGNSYQVSLEAALTKAATNDPHGEIGAGASNYYGTGFIGRVDAKQELVINNLNFENAHINDSGMNINDSHHTSGVAVVVGISYGKTTLNNVNITNSFVYGGEKVGGMIGFSTNASDIIKNGSITNTTIKTYVGMAAEVVGYYDQKFTPNIDAIKLTNNNELIKNTRQGQEFDTLKLKNGMVLADWGTYTYQNVEYKFYAVCFTKVAYRAGKVFKGLNGETVLIYGYNVYATNNGDYHYLNS